jgi:hypothetical protein
MHKPSALMIVISLFLFACSSNPVLPQPPLTVTRATVAAPTLIPAPTRTAIPAALPNSVDLIVSDMTQPHEALLSGVPAAFDWHAGPRMGLGNEPGKLRAMIAWGQVYADAAGNPAQNTRVQLADIQLWLLSKKSATWSRVQGSWRVQGNAFREDFKDNDNIPADVRVESDGSLAIKLTPRYNFHFWTESGRSEIDNTDVAGVYSTVRARLIIDDVRKPDDRSRARVLVGMGADYWLTLTAAWDPAWQNNGDVAIGRMRFVSQTWASYNMSSLSAEALRANPPPITIDMRTAQGY